MGMYHFEIITVITLAIIFLWGGRHNDNNKKFFCGACCVIWIALSGLRHLSIGPDTLNYLNNFKKVVDMPWSSVWNNFYDVYILGEGKDSGYLVFVKLFQYISKNYQIYLVFIAIIFSVPLCMLIYKYSAEPLMSSLIYICLFFSFFGETGTRQTIAIALTTLIGFEFIVRRRFIPFLILCIIAFFIHKSAIFFIPFYFLCEKKITTKYIAAIIIAVPLFFIFRSQIIQFIGEVSGYTDYITQHEAAGSYNFTIVLVAIFLLTIWRSNILLKNNPLSKYYINAVFLATAFSAIVFVDPNAMRLVMYYSFFLLFLIPEIILTFKGKERYITYFVATIVLLALYLKNNPHYLFFWQ